MKNDISSYKNDSILIELLKSRIYAPKSSLKNDGLDAEIEYDLVYDQVQFYLLSIWKRLHGLPLVNDKIRTLPMVSLDYDIEYFYRSSKLWVRRNEPAPISSNLFIGRFLADVTARIISHLSKMVEEYVKYSVNDISGKLKLDTIIQIADWYSDFVKNILLENNANPEDFNRLIILFTLVSDGGSDYRMKLVKMIISQLNNLRAINKNGIFGKGFDVEDPIIISNICLLAYVMTVEDCSLRDISLEIDPDSRFSDKNRSASTIQMLGREIINYKESIFTKSKFSKKNSVAELYDVFYASKPLLSYRFSNVKYNLYLKEGCMALSYMGFFAGSKIVGKILDNFIY